MPDNQSLIIKRWQEYCSKVAHLLLTCCSLVAHLSKVIPNCQRLSRPEITLHVGQIILILSYRTNNCGIAGNKTRISISIDNQRFILRELRPFDEAQDDNTAGFCSKPQFYSWQFALPIASGLLLLPSVLLRKNCGLIAKLLYRKNEIPPPCSISFFTSPFFNTQR